MVVEVVSLLLRSATIALSPSEPTKSSSIIVSQDLITAILQETGKPQPDHLTLPSPAHIFPAKVLMYYFDKQQGRSVAKLKSLNISFVFDDRVATIKAELFNTKDIELRQVVRISGRINKVERLRRAELITALILLDSHARSAEKAKIQKAFEEKTEELEMGKEKFKETIDRLVCVAEKEKHLIEAQSKELKQLRKRLVVADGKLESLTFAYNIKPDMAESKHQHATKLLTATKVALARATLVQRMQPSRVRRENIML